MDDARGADCAGSAAQHAHEGPCQVSFTAVMFIGSNTPSKGSQCMTFLAKGTLCYETFLEGSIAMGTLSTGLRTLVGAAIVAILSLISMSHTSQKGFIVATPMHHH